MKNRIFVFLCIIVLILGIFIFYFQKKDKFLNEENVVEQNYSYDITNDKVNKK